MSQSGGCDYGKATRDMLSDHKTDYMQEKDNMWKQINILHDRLPVWGTVLIALLSGIVGWLGKGA